jgi:hypothetical protein
LKHARWKANNRETLGLIRGLCPALALLALTALVQPVFAQDGAGPLPQQGTTDNRDAAGYGIRVAGYEIRDM